MHGLQRFARGCQSMLGVLLHPIGRFCGRLLADLRTSERLEQGLVFVLPGIDGESFINHSIARGLADGGVAAAIEIFDWTTGVILLFPYHLRGLRRNIARAEFLAQRIIEYQAAYPGRPVHLIGHSAGAALVVFALERLPEGKNVVGAILLQAALSPGCDLSRALTRTQRGIWNFRSLADVFFVGIGTCVAGTADGRHGPSAGMIGFRPPANLDAAGRQLYAERLYDVPYRPSMVADFSFGGHMGCTNRVFVAKHLAPIVKGWFNRNGAV